MKKFLLTAFLVLASGLYVFSKATPTAMPPSTTTSTQVAASDTPAPTQTNIPSTPSTPSTPSPAPKPTPTQPKGQYKDGTYTGPVADAFYGLVQVRATVSGGRLTNVTFLSYPNDRGTSIQINGYATPILAQEAIAAQSAQVDIVSGATDTSQAFRQSLGSALQSAQA